MRIWKVGTRLPCINRGAYYDGIVNAESNSEAVKKVENAYRSGNIVLDSDDFVDKSITSIGVGDENKYCSIYWKLDELVEER